MKKSTIKKVTALFPVTIGSLLILIFMAAMKYPLEKERPLTYLALGDSYTIGENVPPEENFPNQVCRLLHKQGIQAGKPDIVAKTGWTTGELLQALGNKQLLPQYDFVTLLIGVNNQYRGQKTVDYMPEFETLVKEAIRFAGNDRAHVVVLSIPDWGVTPYAAGRDRLQIAREIDEYNAVNKKIAASSHVHYLDITPVTKRAATDPSLLAQDGLHPSGKMYAKWAEQVTAIFQSGR